MNRLTISLFFIFYTVATSASWTPPVHNYTALNSNAGRQNWDIEQGKNGWIYFANNDGLVEFNGIDWSIYKMENNSIVRAVKSADDGTLYIGGQSEFGSFTPDEWGRLKYTNLSRLLPNDIKDDLEEVWDIHTIRRRVYFRFRHNILLLDPYGHFTSIETDGITQASCKMSDNIYFVTTKGLYALGGSAPISVGGENSPVPYDQVSAMVAYGNSIIIATNFNGLFKYSNGKCTPLTTVSDQELKQYHIFSLAINGSQLACGTVNGGVLIIDLKSDKVEHININRGLGNNTLLSVMFDRGNNLWCGLDNGIDKVELSSPLRHLSSNQEYRFSGYCTLVDGDYIYMGTNQGLVRINNRFKNPEKAEDLHFINNSKGQVWSIQKIGEKIYCSHNRGLFTVERDRTGDQYLKMVYNGDGVWGATEVADNRYILGTYDGVELMEIDGSGSPRITKIDNYRGSVGEATYHKESRSLLFVSADGLERLSFDESMNIVANDLLLSNTNYEIKTLRIDDEIVIYTPQQIYEVNHKGNIIQSDIYNSQLDTDEIRSIVGQDNNRGVWSIGNNRLLYHRYNSPDSQQLDKSLTIFTNNFFFIERFTNIEQLSDRHYIINNVSGFSIIDIEQQMEISHTMMPQIIGIYDTNQRDSLILSSAYGVEPKTITLPYSQNSLRIIFGADAVDSNTAEFSYRLQGNDSDWSDWSRISIGGVAGNINQKEYTNLFEGEYQFDLRVRDRLGNIESQSVGIKILPPWQRSIWMYLIYFILFCILIIIIHHRISRYYADRRRLVEVQKEREIELQKRQFMSKSIEQENSIIRLKNEKLESEIVAKSSELSSLMLNKLEKNDIITSVKSDLDKIRIETLNEQYENVVRRITTLSRKLDDKMIDNIDWHTFEENFNLTNNNFAHNIAERFSWMNINERKLCVYIKMGLQNKEMAPLLNLSVRGVEMLRYRIRKKMEIERSESLFEFLQSM